MFPVETSNQFLAGRGIIFFYRRYHKAMDETDFEGSLILEKLASMNLVDEFFEAVDSDNLKEVISLLRQVEIEDEVIAMVINKMSQNSD